jgi:hypothetical protein
MIPRGLTSSLLVSAAMLFPSTDRADDRDIFREAYPQCFRLFAEGSAEHATCLVVLPWNRAYHYSDDALTALVRRETAPTPAGEEFRDLFPRCFTLFPEGSWDRRTCLDVSARHGYARYADDELQAAVATEMGRLQALLLEAEARR